MMPVADASPEPQPCRIRNFFASSDSVTAPNALDSSAVDVTPICTAARKRFGSPTSLATAAPRRPVSARPRTWLSRSETSAISAATKTPSMTIRSRTIPMFSHVAPDTGRVYGRTGADQAVAACDGAAGVRRAHGRLDRRDARGRGTATQQDLGHELRCVGHRHVPDAAHQDVLGQREHLLGDLRLPRREDEVTGRPGDGDRDVERDLALERFGRAEQFAQRRPRVEEAAHVARAPGRATPGPGARSACRT